MSGKRANRERGSVWIFSPAMPSIKNYKKLFPCKEKTQSEHSQSHGKQDKLCGKGCPLCGKGCPKQKK